MLINEIKVRYLIRKKFRVQASTIANLKYMIFDFIQLNSFNYTYDKKKLMKDHIIMTIFAKTISHIPILSSSIKKKIQHTNQSYAYKPIKKNNLDFLLYFKYCC